MSCQNTAFQGPRYFGYTDTAAVVHRHFGAFQLLLGRFHLHFHRPAVVFVFHVQGQKPIPFDGPEGAKVCKMVAKKQAYQVGSQPVTEYLLRLHGAPFQASEGTGSDHHVVAFFENGADDVGHFLWVIGVIAIKENDEAGLLCGGFIPEVFHRFQAGIAIARQGLIDDGSAMRPGYFGGAVPAAIIADDDLTDEVFRYLVHDEADRLLLVPGRDDDSDI